MEETIERYQTEIEDLQKSRKEILRKAKEEVEQLMQEANARIENTIRSIKEAQAEKEKTRQARQELTNFRESMESLTNKELEEKIILIRLIMMLCVILLIRYMSLIMHTIKMILEKHLQDFSLMS